MNLTVQIISLSERLLDLDLDLDLACGIKLIGFYGDDALALKAVEIKRPAIILLDYAIAKDNTALYIESLLIESPNSKVILLGRGLTDGLILSCLMKGSMGYLEWQDIDKRLIKAIRAVDDGEAWFSRKLVGLLVGSLRNQYDERLENFSSDRAWLIKEEAILC